MTKTDNQLDLSVTTLTNDTVKVIQFLCTELPNDTPAIIIGHSMGGAIATRAAATGEIPMLKGLVVIDVVEGTAIPALVHMNTILASKPKSFSSIEEAVKWDIQSQTCRNPLSAKVSMPTQIVKDEKTKQYVWITPLEKSDKYWKDWYIGLSDLFLTVPAAKLLILAGSDRLDKPLTIGQMQGKYQLLVMQGVGHCIQEDAPIELSKTIFRYLSRNGLTENQDDELAKKLERARQMIPH